MAVKALVRILDGALDTDGNLFINFRVSAHGGFMADLTGGPYDANTADPLINADIRAITQAYSEENWTFIYGLQDTVRILQRIID